VLKAKYCKVEAWFTTVSATVTDESRLSLSESGLLVRLHVSKSDELISASGGAVLDECHTL